MRAPQADPNAPKTPGLPRSADGSAGVLTADELRAKSEAYEAQLAEYLRDASPEVTIAICTDSNTLMKSIIIWSDCGGYG